MEMNVELEIQNEVTPKRNHEHMLIRKLKKFTMHKKVFKISLRILQEFCQNARKFKKI